jgi:hypothetical protein
MLNLNVLLPALPGVDGPFSAVGSAGSVFDLVLLPLDLDDPGCRLLMSPFTDIGPGRVVVPDAGVVVSVVVDRSCSVISRGSVVGGCVSFGIVGSRIRISCLVLSSAVRNWTKDICVRSSLPNIFVNLIRCVRGQS